MMKRANNPPGRAVNRAESFIRSARTNSASASVEIERDLIAGHMTIIGRIVAGNCGSAGEAPGVPGVRVLLENGKFAITDAEGRYHFEGIPPGTHIVRVAEATLPKGAKLTRCGQAARTLGKTNSVLLEGAGGSLAWADFYVGLPDNLARPSNTPLISYGSDLMGGEPADLRFAPNPVAPGPDDAAAIDWLALGDGPDGWLSPEIDANPRVPAIRVAFRHRQGQQIRLRVDGKPAHPASFDGTLKPKDGNYAVSLWRGIPLADERTVLTAEIVNSMGGVNATFERIVHFTSEPARVAWVEAQSRLVADGVERPVLVVRITDRNGRPVREGVSGTLSLTAPYESAAQIDQLQINQLAQTGSVEARWVIDGDDGIARIELSPTMVSGPLRARFDFSQDNLKRHEMVEAWVTPGETEWTVVGLGEFFAGSRNLAEHMELGDAFESDLGRNTRLALYAKGRILGRYLVTLAYDSAKQSVEQRLFGALDPNAYYTVFADSSARGHDAASRENLYIRIETANFVAAYGDFQTGFDDTRLGFYQRSATGVNVEAQSGLLAASAFAADVGSRFRRDDLQGTGLSGPYELSVREILPNSESVTVEVRDRFRSEVVLETRKLSPSVDYDIDLLSGTIMLARPLSSRDLSFNPQFLVVSYETLGTAESHRNAGARIEYQALDDSMSVGTTLISHSDGDGRTNIAALDVTAQLTAETRLRAEVAVSETYGKTSEAWFVEAQHQAGGMDMIAYAQSITPGYGVGQQNLSEIGREKFGLDASYHATDRLSVLASIWQDRSLMDDARRRALQASVAHQGIDRDFRLGLSHFEDRLTDYRFQRSTVVEASATQRLLDNRLRLSATGSYALDGPDSAARPNRYVLDARYSLTPEISAVGSYERADGSVSETQTFRAGFEYTPWEGGQIVSSLGQQRVAGAGMRNIAIFGISPVDRCHAHAEGRRHA